MCLYLKTRIFFLKAVPNFPYFPLIVVHFLIIYSVAIEFFIACVFLASQSYISRPSAFITKWIIKYPFRIRHAMPSRSRLWTIPYVRKRRRSLGHDIAKDYEGCTAILCREYKSLTFIVSLVLLQFLIKNTKMWSNNAFSVRKHPRRIGVFTRCCFSCVCRPF